jgi:hypothetical protein
MSNKPHSIDNSGTSSMIFAIIFSSGILSIGYVKNLNAENSEFETQFVMPKVNLTNYDSNTVILQCLEVKVLEHVQSITWKWMAMEKSHIEDIIM